MSSNNRVVAPRVSNGGEVHTSPLVRAFISQLPSGGEVDECFFDYLVAALSQEDIDLDDLDEMLSGVHSSFGAMQPDARLSMLLDVYHQVKEAHAQAASDKDSALPDAKQQQAQLARKPSAEAEAAAPSSAPEALPDERVDQLLALCPVDVSRAFISHLLRMKGNVQAAAEWLLECQDVTEQEREFLRHEEEQRRKQQEEDVMAEHSRRTIIARFALQEIKEPAHGKKGSENPVLLPAAQEKEAPKVRYLNGIAVHVKKGEKYVVETTKEEWDGGSRGKVKTKGKRGKGFA